MSDEDTLDPRNLLFSQAFGYEELPQPLKLEEVPIGVRTKLWSMLYYHVEMETYNYCVSGNWREILTFLHVGYYGYALDEFDIHIKNFVGIYKQIFMEDRFHKLFDLLLAIMRHRKCPQDFIRRVAAVFREERLAYVVDENQPVIIYPAATKEQGEAVLRSIEELNKAGLAEPVWHLRRASDRINHGDHAGAVRECIHAVESTARKLDPTAKNLDQALNSLEKIQVLHPALKQAFSKLYGYTSDEQGIRHALIDGQQPNVGQDEALFMLGACASFSSYLTRKHQDQTS